MKFDDIIDHIGQFGRYQKRVYFLLCLPAVSIAMQTMLTVFILAIPDHRCSVPGLHNDTLTEANKGHSKETNLSLPVGDGNSFLQCHRYRFPEATNSTESQSMNTSQAATMETVACDSWVYDTSVFTSTLITELDLVCEKKMSKSHAQMFAMLGSLIGILVLGPPADLFGRKKVILVSLFVYILSSVAMAFTFSFVYLCVFLFLNGASNMTLYCLCFVLGMELVGVKKRKFAGYVCVIFYGGGVVLLAGLAYLLRDWQHLQLATASLSLIFIGYYWLIPESPRWLISRNRYSEAEVIIRNAARFNKKEVPPEVLKWDSLVMEEAQEPLWRIITYPRLVIRTLIIFVNWMVCSMVYFGLALNVGDLGGSVFLNCFLYGVVEMLSYIACIFLLDRIGRKRLYLASLFIAGLSCASSPFPKVYGGTEYQWLSITFAIIGKFGASAAFATIWVYSSELFPTVIRSSGMASSSISSRLGGVISPYIANMSVVISGPADQILPLEIFGGLSLMAGLISLFLPETRNAKLPETLKDADEFGREQPPLSHKVTELQYLPVSTGINDNINNHA